MALVAAALAVRYRESAGGACNEPGSSRAGDAGFAEGSTLLGRSDAALQRELEEIAGTGVRWLRVDVDWSQIEPAPGEFDWRPTDRVIGRARACGLDVLGLLAYTPGWARPRGSDDKQPPDDPSDFGRFAGEAVERYAPRGVHTWEVWNEPNLSRFWSPAPDAAAYVDLLAAADTAISRADPGATVLSGGLSPAPDAEDGSAIAPATFLEAVYEHGGGAHFDAVAHHPYNYPHLPLDEAAYSNDNAFGGVTPRLHEVMDDHGDGDKEIWATEMGAPTGGDVTTRFLADYITQAYDAWRAWDYTGPLLWYSYRDAGDDTGDPEQNFGLVRADGTPKQPALAAFEAAVGG